MNQLEYFQEHAVDGMLSDEQMATLMTLPEGDTPILFSDPVREPKDDEGESGKPDAASSKPADDKPAQATKDEGQQQPPADGAKPDDKPQGEGDKPPVILAKDGVHTIPYEKLVEARDAEKAAREAEAAAKAEAERLRQELESAKAQPPAAKAGADAGTETDPAKAGAKPGDTGNGAVDFGDYSDEAIAKAVAQLVAQQTAPLQAELEALRGKAGEAEAKATLTAQQEHYAAIYKAHPDADSIAQSAELTAWIDKQPSFARDAYRNTLANGATTDVIELFTTYKDATGKTGAAQPGADEAAKAAEAAKSSASAAAAAQAAIDAATSKPPTSLSEIPAGSAAHHDPAAAMLEASATALLDKFHGKNPDEVMRMLDRVL